MLSYLIGRFWGIVFTIAHAEEVEHVVTHQAPGLTWNISFGQIVQVVTVMVPIYFMWKKGIVNHAMLLRDMQEMRRDLTSVMNRQSEIDLFVRQIQQMISNTVRGHGPGSVILSHESRGMGAKSPAEIALKEEFGGDDGSEELVSRAMEALKKMGSGE